MKYCCLMLGCLLLLTGCADDLRAGVHKLSNEVMNKHDPDDRLQAATRYCYFSISDTLCYAHPQPGMEDRLIGYQEPLVPVTKVYDRTTAYSPHYDPTLNLQPPPLTGSVLVNPPPAVKSAQIVPYDASGLGPKPLIAGAEE
jgi:hypothetical protein